jgi:hypothetical protein
MRGQDINLVAAAGGAGAMLIGVVNSLVPITSGDYRGALITALTCALAGLCCLAVPIVRGPGGWRFAAIVLATPALFIVCDFLRRAPYAFGR